MGGYVCGKTYKEPEEQKASRESLNLYATQERPSWATVQFHLAATYTELQTQFKSIDQDGFQVVGKCPFDT